ncbi:MAG: NAD(P)-binding protein [Syntrophobacteraceae bacterium]|nr:NAD(P)-binding protein [Syntrophobacteraceae bacterium]
MKIAVIGTGISGMVAAHLLSRDHEIEVFEADDYVGGHTHTIDVPVNGAVYPVDTGFIVFNEKTYPNFVKLMRQLGVGWKPTQMSFSVQCEETGLEYSPTSLNALFAQRRNLFKPWFHRMVFDVFRFRREAGELIGTDDDTTTLGTYLRGKRYSEAFIRHFIIPMGEAVWSADPARFDEFPARYFVEFFNNHGFLNMWDQPQWLVIKGGSRSYVEPLTRPYRHAIRTGCPVHSVLRRENHVEVLVNGNDPMRFDSVVIATHSDQALAMLADPSDAEREILGAIPYQENHAILHCDSSLLPTKRSAWASWNYHIPREGLGRVAVTYDMNLLQGLSAPVEFCVSLNLASSVDASRIIRQMLYHHPVYDPGGRAAQKRHAEINGVRRTYFCGAYWGYGFHEDGVKSALAVCKHFGMGL